MYIHDQASAGIKDLYDKAIDEARAMDERSKARVQATQNSKEAAG